MGSEKSIAYFISPHGFGHAARAAAVMEACHALERSLQFEIFTLVPEWFFSQSLRGPFRYHPVLTDIGLVQTDPLREDAEATWERLKGFLPFDPGFVESLAQTILGLSCRLVLCDISPLGIAVAQKAGIPSVLVENFTWDWIYEGYAVRGPEVEDRIVLLRGLFESVQYRVQTEPFSTYCPSAQLRTPPVSRKPRMPPEEVRKRLGVDQASKMVMVTMGGLSWTALALEDLEKEADVWVVIPGVSDRIEQRGHVILLPHHSVYFHPDLVHASDAVVGKAGYSTLAEVYDARIPFGYIPRSSFRESEALTAFIKNHMPGLPIKEEGFRNGSWVRRIPELLSLPPTSGAARNGADEIGRLVLDLLSAKSRHSV